MPSKAAERSAFRQRCIFDADAVVRQRKVERRKYCRNGLFPEHEGEQRDLGCDDEIIGVAHELIGALPNEWRSGHSYDPRGPMPAETGDDPQPCNLEHNESAEQR